MANVTLNILYKELLSLRSEVKEIRQTLIPEEKLSKGELDEIKQIRKEMESGAKTSLRSVI